MLANKILPLLDKVRSTGPHSWIACCPVHSEKTPSFTIDERDGRLLLHCFGCQAGIGEIVDAVGLTIGDLFPENTSYNCESGYRRDYFNARDVLVCLAKDCTLVELVANKVHRGEKITDNDMTYLHAAVKRIHTGVEYGK